MWLVELLGSEKLVDVSLGDRWRFVAEVRADARVAMNDAVGLVMYGRVRAPGRSSKDSSYGSV